jgi:voltage-gated sodium channel
MNEKLKRFVDGGLFQGVVLGLILVNAAILGAETLPGVKQSAGPLFFAVDRVIIYAFTIEIALRILADRANYLKSGWNIFDFIIVLISLFATSSGLAAIRAFRVLRVLRVVTILPRMRVVVSALLDAIPGIASVGVVVVLIVYVFAVIAANLYGPAHPDIFGDVFIAMYTLFQVMTLEGWPDIAAAVAATHPRSWVFFLTFVLIATFTMLNLFVAIVVRSVDADAESNIERLAAEHRALHAEIAELKAMVAALGPRSAV